MMEEFDQMNLIEEEKIAEPIKFKFPIVLKLEASGWILLH
jgi:hypothetical protein